MKQINNNRIHFGLFDYPINEINTHGTGQKKIFDFFPFNFSNRLNQFHFTGICGPDFFISMAVIDLKLITKAFCYVFNRKDEKVHFVSTLDLPSKKKRFISPTPENENTRYQSGKISATITSEIVELNSRQIDLKIRFKRALEPIRLCTRTGAKGWTYTKKELPHEIDEGFLRLGNERHIISSPDYYMVSDWTMGLMRRETYWNWASSACRLSSGQTFGLNLSCGVNETSYTENAFWIDGTRNKVDLVSFEYEKPEMRWTVKSRDGKVNLFFVPVNNYQENVNALIFASRFNQLTGNFYGELVCDNGETVRIENCPGWTEDHYAKW